MFSRWSCFSENMCVCVCFDVIKLYINVLEVEILEIVNCAYYVIFLQHVDMVMHFEFIFSRMFEPTSCSLPSSIYVYEVILKLWSLIGLLCFEGTLISVVKVVQFAWTFWRISGVQHLRWRQPCFLCRHCYLLLNLMILKMLSWHNRYC